MTQSSTTLAGSCDANEMSIPCDALPGRERISQSLIATSLWRALIPSSSADSTTTSSISTLSASRTSIPYSPPRTVRLRRVTSSAVTTMPPRTIAPGFADDRLGVVEDERALVDAGREADRRRLDRPGDPEHREQRHRRGRREAETGAAELAAVLRPRQAEEGEARVREQLREQPRRREEEQRRPQRRAELEEPRPRDGEPELEQSERHGRPAGLVGEQWVVRRPRRARARSAASARRARAATTCAGSARARPRPAR